MAGMVKCIWSIRAKLVSGFVMDVGIKLTNPREFAQALGYGIVGAAFFGVGNFCFKAGNVLWGRFDFGSEMVWVEAKGNYQSASMQFGNELTDRMKTKRQVISIENMTLRIWRAQIDTVAFGKNAPRSLLAMRGLPDKAKYLSDHLRSFGS